VLTLASREPTLLALGLRHLPRKVQSTGLTRRPATLAASRLTGAPHAPPRSPVSLRSAPGPELGTAEA
jgi:hypothetical protein